MAARKAIKQLVLREGELLHMMNMKNINQNVVMDVEVDMKDRKMDTRMKVTTNTRKTHLQH